MHYKIFLNFFLAASTLLLGFTPSASRAETYLCTSTKSVGFRLKENWAIRTFNVEKEKYIFRSVKPNEKDGFGKNIPFQYVVYEFGHDFIDARNNGCTSNKAGNLYFCDIWGTDFIFNISKRRFQSWNKFGYVLEDDKDFRADVATTIGECSKID